MLRVLGYSRQQWLVVMLLLLLPGDIILDYFTHKLYFFSSHQAVGLWVEGISKVLGVQFVTYIWTHQPLARKKHVIITHKMLIRNDLASVCLHLSASLLPLSFILLPSLFHSLAKFHLCPPPPVVLNL